MTEYIKKFIEDNINLIEENRWGEVYANITPYVKTISSFNQIIKDAGINPLEYLYYIPTYYFARNDMVDYTIPENIIEIRFRAFVYCENLKQVTIHKQVKHIGNDVFKDCPNLKDIDYEGTREEWEHVVEKSSYWDRDSFIQKVYCKDGVIDLLNIF